MLPRLLGLIAAFLFYASTALAQTYEPGLVVRSNGDTVRGEVENNFWTESPKFIHFRQTPGAAAELLWPRQLQAVVLMSGRYFSCKVLQLDHAAESRRAMLPYGNKPNVRTDTVLAEVLVSGAGTLLRVERPGSTHYFVQRPDRPTLELAERQYYQKTSRGTWAVAEGNNYSNQLQLYFVDCPAADSASRSANFTPLDLAAVVQAYNRRCSALQQPGRSWLATAAPRRRLSFQGGVLAGARYNFFGNTRYHDGTEACSDCQVHPFAGLYADLFLPNRTDAFYGELSVGSFRGRGETTNTILTPTGTGYTYTPYRYSSWLGTARLGFRHFYPMAHEQQLLFGIGIELLGSFSTSITEGPQSAISSLGTGIGLAPLANATAGWRRNRFTLSTDIHFYSTQATSLRLGLAYRLSRNPDAQKPAAANP